MNHPDDLDLGSAAELQILPDVARDAILAHLEGREPRPRVEAAGASALRAPVFVTLKIDGELRGCMGTLEARRDDVVAETIDRAVVAASGDPRFPPLTPRELDACAIDVTILGPLEPVESEADLDPGRFGLELTDESGRGAVLLPDLEGIETVAQQMSVCRRKAGIPPAAPVQIRRFRALRLSEIRSTQR